LGFGSDIVRQCQQQIAQRRDLRADARPASEGKVTDRHVQRSDLLDDRPIGELVSRTSRERRTQTAKEAVMNWRDDGLGNTSVIC
jgi:hypothetical protein